MPLLLLTGFLPKPVRDRQSRMCVARKRYSLLAMCAALSDYRKCDEARGDRRCRSWLASVMMMAAINPNKTGPIVLAGARRYHRWAGVRGKNPLSAIWAAAARRYWLTTHRAALRDIGTVRRREPRRQLNRSEIRQTPIGPKPITSGHERGHWEAARFLDFETWWGSPVILRNAEEMQWIADNLFVGNRLCRGDNSTHPTEFRIDLRNITAPIVVFYARGGDNITPPQRGRLTGCSIFMTANAEIVENGRTIVYTMHRGHRASGDFRLR